MHKFITTLFLCGAFAIALLSCSTDNKHDTPTPNNQTKTETATDKDKNNTTMKKKITVKVGETRFTATLEDNATAKAFEALLPQTFEMNEHAGNEKFYNLDHALPTAAFLPGTIQAGDIMLWGDNCVVLFYQTFSSSYRYTRIGKINDAAALAAGLGTGSVRVTFEPAL